MLNAIWLVSDGGYYWTKGKKPFLDEKWVGKSTDYDPLSKSGLFLTFSGTEPTKPGILQFANRFGLLSLEGKETLKEWQREITMMRQAVEIWGLVEKGKLHILEQYPETELPSIDSLIDRRRQKFGLPKKTRNDPRDKRKARQKDAVVWIVNVVSDRLKEVQLVFRPHAQNSPLGIGFIVRSLRAALWLQFAQAVHGKRELHWCRECQKAFQVEPPFTRRTKRYCSDSCRVRAYQKRRAKAQHMATQGLNPTEIAKELGTDAKTVRGWIKAGGA